MLTGQAALRGALGVPESRLLGGPWTLQQAVLCQQTLYSTRQEEQSGQAHIVSTGTLYLGLSLPSPKQLSGQPGVECLQTPHVNGEEGTLATSRLCRAPAGVQREADLGFVGLAGCEGHHWPHQCLTAV